MDKHFKYKYEDLFNPTLKALKKLGGSGAISEIEEEVAQLLNLSEEATNEIHRESTTKLSYRLAWARNYLKHYGLIENSSRGVWALTEEGQKTNEVNQEKVKKAVIKKDKEERLQTKSEENNSLELKDTTEEIEEFSWQDKLLDNKKHSPRPN